MHQTTDPVATAEYFADKSNSVSGGTYVSAMLRENVDRYPQRDYLVRLPVGTFSYGHGNCDHGHTICATWECVESWSVDYKLMLYRTGGGRLIAAKLRIPATFRFDRQGIAILRHEDCMIEDPVNP